MSFSVDWLTTRRAADFRARNPDIAARLSEHFAGRKGLRVLDLGCGTGSNMVATSALLSPDQHWVLADNDPELLRQITPTQDVTFQTRQIDLASDLDQLFQQPFDLVTASALFDLAGIALIDRLADHVVTSSAAFYTVLTYDGSETWSPPHPDDATVLAAFHADQHSDKGLGAALGPDATDHLKARFQTLEYAVHVGKSDWQLSADTDGALIAMLSDGIGAAVHSKLGAMGDQWATQRQSANHVTIGHLDLLALPSA